VAAFSFFGANDATPCRRRHGSKPRLMVASAILLP
jgi:hypothetical protein